MNIKHRRIILLTSASAILLLIIIQWLQNGRTTAQSARAAYLSADCQTALPLYEKLTDYPDFAGAFVTQAANEQQECQAYEAARETADQPSQTAITAYERFITAHQNSPLTTPALAAIHRLYLDWATAELQANHFAQSIAILEKATADYPALEAETEERLLQSYLAWGEALQAASDYQAALIVYNDLQSNYPQFTAEAQAGINSVNQFIK